MFFDVSLVKPNSSDNFSKENLSRPDSGIQQSQDNFDIHQRHAAQEDPGGYEVDTIFMTSHNWVDP